jgi:hypothetical protein
MNCDRCGQRVNEVPACEHRSVGQAPDGTLRCMYCGHDFGPVRELIEKAAKWDDIPTTSKVLQERIDLRAQVATLTRERDEARARIAELENRVFNGRTIQVHANGTWEWRKV